MPNLGPQYDLAARLATLEDTVRRMQANPLAQAFSMTQSDGSVGMELGQDPQTGSGRWIVYQGVTTARDPDTDQHPPLLYVGEILAGGVLVDSGALWFRPDGSESMTIGDGGAGILDAKGHQAFTTNEAPGATGEGIAHPLIPLPLPQPTATNSWPNTDATSWGFTASSWFKAQQPRVFWNAAVFAPTSVTGQAQALVKDGAGNLLASSAVYTASNGGFTNINETLPELPSGFMDQLYNLQVMAQVTAGTGSVYVTTFGAYGSP